jgi:hypothetical protein
MEGGNEIESTASWDLDWLHPRDKCKRAAINLGTGKAWNLRMDGRARQAAQGKGGSARVVIARCGEERESESCALVESNKRRCWVVTGGLRMATCACAPLVEGFQSCA